MKMTTSEEVVKGLDHRMNFKNVFGCLCGKSCVKCGLLGQTPRLEPGISVSLECVILCPESWVGVVRGFVETDSLVGLGASP